MSEDVIGTVVTSDDGTPIGLRAVGSGPGLIVLPGTLRAAKHYRALADALAADFTVHVVDRRGRGASGPQGDGYGIDTECADLAAVLAHTGARMVFGHSYGGLVALETALRRSAAAIEKLAVYEPPVSAGGAITDGWLPDLERAVAEDRTADGVGIVMAALDLFGPLRTMSPALRTALVGASLRGGAMADMRALLPTVKAELVAARRLDSSGARYNQVHADTLLLCGERSPGYLRQSTTVVLAAAMPRSRAITLPGVGHNAPDLDAPGQVAQRLRAFFAA